MSREFKHFQLKSSPRPLKGGRYDLISSTVAVYKHTGEAGYCYVSFSDSFVGKMGGKFDSGLTKDKLAYLQVIAHETGHTVYLIALGSREKFRLWSGSELPAWLKFYKVKKVKVKAK